MSKSDLFEETCAGMGGSYEEEYGMLEPDVGGMFPDVHEAKKQWCTFKDMKGIGKGELTVFNAPNTFTMKYQDTFLGKELFSFWDNDIEKKFDPEKQRMCFYSKYGIRVPKCDVCVETYPEKGDPQGVWLKLNPR